jgi:hypothetical protein
MPRYRDDKDEDSGSSSFLFLAAGALAGIAAGVYLAQRFGGVAGLTSRIRERFSATSADPAPPLGDDEEDTETHHAHRHFADDPYDDDVDEIDDDAEGDSDDAGDDESADDEIFVSADEELEERVLETFVNDPILRERAIDIGAIDEATIELTGHVFSHAESDHAVVIARGTPGVQAVINQLTVRADEQDGDDTADDLSVPSPTRAGAGDRPWTPAPPPNGG